ncbi:MAG: RNA polymerase sigma factor [Candidatus Promineifilaceae bacterium]|jgi:RNA polymerase sigma-70 factor (ECF subfamily)
MALLDTPDKEAGLAAAARNGDETAWEALIQQHQEAVFRLAYLIIGDADDAQDVAQGAFIRAYKKLDQYDAARPLRPWLLGITANMARNRQRSIGRYLNAMRRYWQANVEHTAARPLAGRANAQLLWEAVQHLPQAMQEVIYLRYFLEMSELETAETLSVAPGTIKSRTHRALQKLRGIILNKYPELADEWD